MGSYYDDYYNKNLKKTQDEIKKQQTQNTTTSNAYVADLNAIVDKNISNSVNKVQGEIDKLPTQYQSSFDANAIQQLINERQVAERMANMGMTNSGLNRTQQTAINIQRSNADAALRTQINSATNSLKQQIADLYASGESQKAENAAKERYNLEQKNQSVYDTMMNNLYSNASAYETAQIDAAAKIEEARIKAEQDAQKNKLNLSEDEFDEAYELYDPNNEDAFYDYIEKLELLGYSDDMLKELIDYVISKKGTTKQRAWQGPIYQPSVTQKSSSGNSGTKANAQKNSSTSYYGWSGLW